MAPQFASLRRKDDQSSVLEAFRLSVFGRLASLVFIASAAMADDYCKEISTLGALDKVSW